MKKILLLILLSVSMTVFSQNLPHYRLSIAPADLDSMNAHPKDEAYYKAVLYVDIYTYNVLARYKGSTSLNYPKRSWAIKFPDANNYFGASRINLHADYKDYSNMRNFLIMNLFEFLGSPASRIKHITYEVNGQPYGIHTQTEQIDNEYLVRNGRTSVSLYKARNHGALMAPAVHDEYYGVIWETEAGGDPTLNELRVFFNKCLYWSKADFDANISNEIDVDNFLNFFAVHFVFADMDNFTKNIFLNKNSNTMKWELLPWDNEGSFGNSAFGVFDSTLVEYNMRDAHTPEYQVVFQRLLENATFRTLFQTKVNRVLTDGFPMLDTLIDNTYLRIKQDVYADTKREATNEDFDNSIPRLKWFMSQRKTFLENNTLPERNVLTDFYCSNPMPTAGNSQVTFRIASPVEQHVNMFFADSVDFNIFGQPFKFSRMQLYDDGLHDDLLANDFVYGNTKDVSNFVSPLIPFAITGAEQNYPPNGIFYVDYYGSKSFAINKGNSLGNIADSLAIGDMFKYGSNYFVEVKNTSILSSIDLSYCHLRTNEATKDFMFPEQVVLEPNETIYISSNYNLGNQFFNGKRSFYNLYYQLAVGDSLHLLSPVLTPLISAKVNAIQTLTVQSPPLVINEINYKSGTAKPMGDWVEIYNPNSSTVDLSGWIFKDGDNKHAFPFPYGYLLPANGYVVVAEDSVVFKAACPTVSNFVGNTAFGLSGTGEPVRLYDNYGQIIDSVNYSIAVPWPMAAAGFGATLELKNPTLDNTDGNNWFADILKNGSPGIENYLSTAVTEIETLNNNIHPNPTTGVFFINTDQSDVQIELIDLQGRILKHINLNSVGEHVIDITGLPAGIYFVKKVANGERRIEKLIVK
ncbi:MAG: T9SS type A sorting domain-containing protein [Paludibacter sp.]|nr:T9SS type A sorting domain-containing protein [Paludibacter sp.]